MSAGDITQNSAAQYFQNQVPSGAGPTDAAPPAVDPGSFDSSGTPKLGPDDAHQSSPSLPNQFVPQQPQQPEQPAPVSTTPFQDAAMQQAQQAAWAQRLAQAGYQPPQTPDELANAYLQSQQQLAQMQTYAQYGQQFLPYAQQFTEFLRSRAGNQPSPPQQQEAETPKQQRSVDEILKEHWNKMWKAPEYDPAWESLVKLNPETQLYEGINPFVPANVVQGMNSYREWKRKSLNDLIDKPFELTWQAISPGINEIVKQQIDSELQAQRINSEFDALEEQYSSILYEHDANGNRVVDPFTGGPKWTAFGQHVADEMRRLSASGLKDPFLTFEYAVNSAKAIVLDRQMKNGQQQPQQMQPQFQQPVMAPPMPGQFAAPQYPMQAMPPGYAPPGYMPQQPQLPASAQRFGLTQPAPQYAQQPYVAQPMPVPSMYAPAVSAGQSVFGGYAAGINGQLPAGGGFLAQPASFLDNARMAHAGHQAPVAAPSGESDFTEDFFSREASRLGYIRAA